jgi:hypothetical protein
MQLTEKEQNQTRKNKNKASVEIDETNSNEAPTKERITFTKESESEKEKTVGLANEQTTVQDEIQVNDSIQPQATATPLPNNGAEKTGTEPEAPARRKRGRPRKTEQQKKADDEKTNRQLAQPTSKYSLRKSIRSPVKLTY